MMVGMAPRRGDIVVSNRAATIEHEISVVPDPPQLAYGSQHAAVAKARDLAERLRVDAWLTEDRTHFMRIASYRLSPDTSPEQSAGCP
jgi:hypothetical protein